MAVIGARATFGFVGNVAAHGPPSPSTFGRARSHRVLATALTVTPRNKPTLKGNSLGVCCDADIIAVVIVVIVISIVSMSMLRNQRRILGDKRGKLASGRGSIAGIGQVTEGLLQGHDWGGAVAADQHILIVSKRGKCSLLAAKEKSG